MQWADGAFLEQCSMLGKWEVAISIFHRNMLLRPDSLRSIGKALGRGGQLIVGLAYIEALVARDGCTEAVSDVAHEVLNGLVDRGYNSEAGEFVLGVKSFPPLLVDHSLGTTLHKCLSSRQLQLHSSTMAYNHTLTELWKGSVRSARWVQAVEIVLSMTTEQRISSTYSICMNIFAADHRKEEAEALCRWMSDHVNLQIMFPLAKSVSDAAQSLNSLPMAKFSLFFPSVPKSPVNCCLPLAILRKFGQWELAVQWHSDVFSRNPFKDHLKLSSYLAATLTVSHGTTWMMGVRLLQDVAHRNRDMATTLTLSHLRRASLWAPALALVVNLGPTMTSAASREALSVLLSSEERPWVPRRLHWNIESYLNCRMIQDHYIPAQLWKRSGDQ